VGFLGGGSEPPRYQLGGLVERYKLPQRGAGRSPGKLQDFGVFWNLRNHVMQNSQLALESGGQQVNMGARAPPPPPAPT